MISTLVDLEAAQVTKAKVKKSLLHWLIWLWMHSMLTWRTVW